MKGTANLSFDIHRKPSTTDTIIPNDSCHPQEQKHGAIRYLANRMITHNLNAINKGKENSTIIQILHNKKYDTSILNKFTTYGNKIKHNTSKTKWANFIFVVLCIVLLCVSVLLFMKLITAFETVY